MSKVTTVETFMWIPDSRIKVEYFLIFFTFQIVTHIKKSNYSNTNEILDMKQMPANSILAHLAVFDPDAYENGTLKSIFQSLSKDLHGRDSDPRSSSNLFLFFLVF